MPRMTLPSVEKVKIKCRTEKDSKPGTRNLEKRDTEDTNSFRGNWSLICDHQFYDSLRQPESEKILKACLELHKSTPNLFPFPPTTFWNTKKKHFVVNIATSDYRDEIEIERAADAIRRNIDFPFIMYYYKSAKCENNLLYMHTPEGNEACITTADMLLPSKVFDRDYIFLPHEDFDRVAHGEGGKWLLFTDNEQLDTVWKSLVPLYNKGILSGIKSATAKTADAQRHTSYNGKAVLCYTRNANCKNTAKRAADNIRVATSYGGLMYYKCNEASVTGKYCHEGYKHICKYMHTVKGGIYERDNLKRWKRLTLEEEKQD